MLKLVRYVFDSKRTLGKLFIDGVFFAHTLEDRDRYLENDITKKVQKESAIPAGKYEVIVNISERFKRELPLILNVSGFSGVRFHGGNTEEDTEGCILVGAKTNGFSNVYDCKKKVEFLTSYIKERGKLEFEIVRDMHYS